MRKLLKTDQYIDCRIDKFNKPFLFNFPYYISISHSKGYAAAIISPVAKVGIDVEVISDKILRVAPRFLSPRETDFIEKEHEIHQLYACWGAKEALYKVYGKGNLPFIGGIEIHPFKLQSEGTLTATIHKKEFDRAFNVHYRLFDEYMLCYTCGSPDLSGPSFSL